MDSQKFLILDSSYIAKKLENWKCSKCGSTDKPKIFSREPSELSEDEIDMYIKCCNCDTVISVKSI